MCEFYNSVDGCRSGATCPYQHITANEKAVDELLTERSGGRFDASDVKWSQGLPSHGCSFSAFFGDESLKKKHARSISLLYSKKLKQCPNCALRLSAQHFQPHLKWHFERRNAVLTRRKRTQSLSGNALGARTRKWWLSEEQWLSLRCANVSFAEGTENETAAESKEANPFLSENVLSVASQSVSSLKAIAKEAESAERRCLLSCVVISTANVSGVLCVICNEAFLKTSVEYNALSDEWMLKGACFEDGTTKKEEKGKEKGKGKEKRMVHRKCWELREKQKGLEREALKPKMCDDSDVVAMMERQLNETQSGKGSVGVSENGNGKRKNGRKRGIEHLFGASDAEEEEEEEEDGEEEGSENEGVKRRKLNVTVEKRDGIGKGLGEECDEDDLQGMVIEDEEERVDEEVSAEVKVEVKKEEKKQKETQITDTENDGDGNVKKEEEKEKVAVGDDEEADADLDSEDELDELDDLENISLTDDDDDEDEDDAGIVLFDPSALNEGGFSGGWRGTAY